MSVIFQTTNAFISAARPYSEALPLLWHILLLQVLRVLVTQLEVRIPDCLLDPLLTAQTDNRADTLLDRPRCRDACHADVVLLRDLLNTADDLLVDLIFPAVDEVFEELVGLCARRGAVGPGTREGAAGDGGPGDQAYAGVFAVWDLIISSAWIT